MNHSSKSNSNNAPDNQVLIDQLVDGELNHSTRSQWLSKLDPDSPLWRDLALAFVEKQVTDEALCGFSMPAATIQQKPVGSHINTTGILAPHSAVHTRTENRRWRPLLWLAGLAACLLAGVFIGKQSVSRPNMTVVENNDGSNESSNLDASAKSTTDLADALSRSVAPVPVEFRRALMKAGYSLHDRRTITNVTLPSGGQIELPIRDVDVTYVGLDSFQ